jgi:hypothetical protein
VLTKTERMALIRPILGRYLPEPERTYATEDIERALTRAGLEPMTEIEPVIPTLEDLTRTGSVYLKKAADTDDAAEVAAAWEELRQAVDPYTLNRASLAPILFALAALAGKRSEQDVPDWPDWKFIQDHLEMAAEGANGTVRMLTAPVKRHDVR